MTKHEATVEVLTAEVRVLMVGSRQITLSVARQLDRVDPEEIEPFGRVRLSQPASEGLIEVVGSHNGSLCRSYADRDWHNCSVSDVYGERGRCREHRGLVTAWAQSADPNAPRPRWDAHRWWTYSPCRKETYEMFAELPLIVLAGLR